MCTNDDGTDDQSQSLETYLMTKKYFYQGWFVTLGGGAAVLVEADEADRSTFGLLGEVGYTMYGFDAFLGMKFNDTFEGKQKFLYFGVGLQ